MRSAPRLIPVLAAYAVLASAWTAGAQLLPPVLSDGRIVWGGQRHRVLHFTFDDGPEVSTTGPLLRMLDRFGIHATFFVVARRLNRAWRGSGPRRALIERMLASGHHIGAHSWDHPHLPELSDEDIAWQLERSEAVLGPLIGARPTLFRPPYGEHTRRVDRVVVEHGYTLVMWNVRGEPLLGPTDADSVVRHFRRELDARERHEEGQGAIVVLHDNRPETVRAFPRLVAEIARRNCLLRARGERPWVISDDLGPFWQSRGPHDGPGLPAILQLELPPRMGTAKLDEDC